MIRELFEQYWPAFAAAAFAILALSAWLVYRWLHNRPTPEELERRRREKITNLGKMGDGIVTEFQEHVIYYTYHVRGIEYQANQDVSAIADHLPPDGIIGPIGIKYDARNPANSIVVSEVWTGIRPSTIKVESENK